MMMQQRQRKAAAATLSILLLMLTQQVCAAPLSSQGQSSSDQSPLIKTLDTVPSLRRVARMTPLWRIMNSKPLGAYCQNNYECSTGICRAGHCSTSHRSPSEPVNY